MTEERIKSIKWEAKHLAASDMTCTAAIIEELLAENAELRLQIAEAKDTCEEYCQLATNLAQAGIELSQKLASAPHSSDCESRLLPAPAMPWSSFQGPVCRSMNGCGSCEKCKWLALPRTRIPLPCNCWKSAVRAGTETARV